MAYRNQEPVQTNITFGATLIPHSVDGKHSVEIVLTDTRWPTGIPRPSITVELTKPFDPITAEAERKIQSALAQSLLKFASVGVANVTITNLKKQAASELEKAHRSPEELPTEPRAPVDLQAVTDAMKRVEGES